MILISVVLLFSYSPSFGEYLLHLDQCKNTFSGGNVFAANTSSYGLYFFDEDPSASIGQPRGKICGNISGIAIREVEFSARARETKIGRQLISKTPNPNNCSKVVQFLNGERKVLRASDLKWPTLSNPSIFKPSDRQFCCGNAKASGLTTADNSQAQAIENPTRNQLIDLFVEHNPQYRSFPRQCFDDSRLSRQPSQTPSNFIDPQNRGSNKTSS